MFQNNEVGHYSRVVGGSRHRRRGKTHPRGEGGEESREKGSKAGKETEQRWVAQQKCFA